MPEGEKRPQPQREQESVEHKFSDRQIEEYYTWILDALTRANAECSKASGVRDAQMQAYGREATYDASMEMLQKRQVALNNLSADLRGILKRLDEQVRTMLGGF